MSGALIVGNWKMHKSIPESVAFARQLRGSLLIPPGREAVIAPAFTALRAVADVLAESAIGLAAQNVHDQQEGAYTGEISAPMLVDAGCRYVIVGHSERRTLCAETDAIINRKVATALACRLKPIFCVGESLDEREKNMTFSVIERQLREGLNNLGDDDIREVCVAYEPVWAIGTGRTASPEQAREVHAFIRRVIDGMVRNPVSRDLKILYGGSVNPGNIRTLMREEDIDGALVGGASLEIKTFSEIVNY